MGNIAAAFAQPIAHRGLHDRRKGVVENSADAFAAAIESGFAIECDIQLTGDDEAVVFHDEELDRLTEQKGELQSLSADQLCHIPLKDSKNTPQKFAEFLNQVVGQVPLVVELKSQGSRNSILAQKVVQIADEYAGPLVFKSFDPRILMDLRKCNCKWPIGIVLEREKPEELNALQGFAARHLLHFPWTRFDFISCNVNDLNLPLVRFFRMIGYKVMTWTVRTQPAHDVAAIHADQIVFEGTLPSEPTDEAS